MSRSSLRRIAASAAAAVLVVSGCSLDGGAPEPEGGTPTTLPSASVEPGERGQEADPRFAPFYEQQLAWEDCRDALECASLTVPVDWDDPSVGTLDLALVRRPADAGRIGSLVMNPGGPGVSGVDYLANAADAVTTRDLRERFDLVSFDPRGVGGSEPVDCLTDPEMDDFLALDVDPTTPRGLEAARDTAREFAAGCAEDAGPLLGNVDTISAARDMDVLRAALGEERLDYLGGSYGTLLGAAYADRFPERTGRMVLDGAIDPALTYTDLVVGQARGMERALRAYVEDCLDRRECPLRGSVEDGLEQVRSVLDAAEDRPLRTGDADRPLTPSLAMLGLVAPLYAQETWPALDAALEGALAGDGSVLLRLADAYANREQDGTYGSNLLEAFNVINCLDYPVDASPEAMAAAAEQLEEASPTFGGLLAYGEVLCAEWPVPAVREPAPLDAEGAPPILVVGTTGDPATPYEWAEALAEQLDSGRLLTREGEGHTAYMRGSVCVDNAVDRYLIDGVLPGEGATCR